MPGDAAAGDAAAVELAESVRRLMQSAVLTTVDDDTRRDVAAQIDDLTKHLSEQSRDTMPWPDPESMRRGHRPYSPVIGAANPIAPPMTVRTLEDGSVVGEATMRPIHEGPPAVVHGGWVATLLDQLLGHANAAAGVGGFTAELTVRYRRPTPYDVPLTVRARTDSVDGRRVRASGEIVADGVVTAEASGLFLMPSEERLAEVAQQYEDRRASG
ncbi:MAG TPA: PaaI family thioesterase [Mycobacteriales bacterium]|nr:PaaI family thioesterase [Mycobacteriales bacterium]